MTQDKNVNNGKIKSIFKRNLTMTGTKMLCFCVRPDFNRLVFSFVKEKGKMS